MSTPTEVGLAKATDYQIDSLLLIGASGRSADLRSVMIELNLFEDLFASTMSGTILLSDTTDLINVIGLVGTEYLLVELSKPGTPWKLAKAFRVYKVTDRQKTGTFGQSYLLNFCSEELILNESRKISKAYKGRSVSDMITDIARTYLGISATKLPDTAITKTTGSFDVVIPYWQPFYTINWLSRMALTGNDQGGTFVFFEDSQGYHFQSLETLSQQAVLQDFNFMPANFEGDNQSPKSDMQRDLESAEKYTLEEGPDILRSISTGMYAGKLITINTLSQKITTVSMNAQVLFNGTKHLNKYSILSPFKDRTESTQTEYTDSYFRVMSDGLGVDKWILQRNAYFSAMHSFRVKVAVPGSMNLRVGQVVKFNLPSPSGPDPKVGKKEDMLYAGKYMITAIRHKIDQHTYACVVELSKDSIQQPLLPPLQNNPGLKKMKAS